MDDHVVYDPARPIMVANLDMRLYRIRARRAVHRRQCQAGRDLPRHLPSRGANKLRRLGEPLVCVQQRGDGMVSPGLRKRHSACGNVVSRLMNAIKYLVRGTG